MKITCGVLMLTTVLLTGCSIIPYEDEFACNMPDSLGKCQNMSDSYDEAITGIETAQPMVPVSKMGDEPKAVNTSDHSISPAHVIQTGPTSYERYIDDYYSTLQRLIVQPKNPIIRQPTQVRMLVFPYSSQDQSVMYMSRHVYWVHRQPHFILGDYMKKPSEILDSPMMTGGSN
jgi:conjugal transfer pilus assembly protein TraV